MVLNFFIHHTFGQFAGNALEISAQKKKKITSCYHQDVNICIVNLSGKRDYASISKLFFQFK